MDGFDGLKTNAPRIGRIVSVAGCQAVCVLERDIHGEVAALQIGGLVKTQIGKSQVYGLVSGVSIPGPSAGDTPGPEMKVVELMLIGEAVLSIGMMLMPNQSRAFPNLEWVFSMRTPIRMSLKASKTRQTRMMVPNNSIKCSLA